MKEKTLEFPRRRWFIWNNRNVKNTGNGDVFHNWKKYLRQKKTDIYKQKFVYFSLWLLYCTIPTSYYFRIQLRADFRISEFPIGILCHKFPILFLQILGYPNFQKAYYVKNFLYFFFRSNCFFFFAPEPTINNYL